jgi:hypothetical protein
MAFLRGLIGGWGTRGSCCRLSLRDVQQIGEESSVWELAGAALDSRPELYPQHHLGQKMLKLVCKQIAPGSWMFI